MKIASWNGAVIAQSERTIVVEGNHYFPAETVNSDYLIPSDTTSRCMVIPALPSIRGQRRFC